MIKFSWEDNQEKITKFREFIDRHRDMDGALMPVLQEAQSVFGYIPEEIVDLISDELNILTSEIYGVATFYAQFTFVPKGEYAISVCMGTACYVNGAEEILEEFKQELGIKVGETTDDMKFSIVDTRCVGACSEAPVVIVNDKVYSRFAKSDVKGLIKKLRQGGQDEYQFAAEH